MKQWIDNYKRFFRDDNGLEVVEYGIIMGVVVVATLLALTALGLWANQQYTTVNTKVVE